jgi:hypothetical protein
MDLYDTINNLKIEIAFGVVLFSILFFQIQQANTKTLLSMLLITLWAGAAWFYLQYKNKQIDTQEKKELKVIEDENEKKLEVPEIISSNYYVKAAPKKGLQYMKKNEVLVNMAKELIFVKTFDEQKYQDLLVFMNDYQKVYMYILAERYPCQSYVPTFIDLRENILQLLYQLYLVIPKTFKHIYGVNPYQTIEKNIETFMKLSRTMLEVLENFCRLDLKEYYFPETNPMPFDTKKEKHLLP